MLPSLALCVTMRTSFGSPRRQLFVAVISTLSLVEARTFRSPFTLRTRTHAPAGTRSLSDQARSICRPCGGEGAGHGEQDGRAARVRSC